ncbi:MAG: Qat anti-phage system associated protein QatB [Phycisphaerales bacterium]
MSHFASSGGKDTSRLGRAISHYVRTASGGSGTATRRMAPSRTTAAGLVGFLQSARVQGVTEALRHLNLQELSGQPVEKIFVALADAICPDGGTIDEAIAREAFIETIAEVVEAGLDLAQMTADQMLEILEAFIANSIEARLHNDIGMKVVALPSDLAAIRRVQTQIHDFVRGAVHDAVHRTSQIFDGLVPARIEGLVREVYISAFDLMAAMAEGME